MKKFFAVMVLFLISTCAFALTEEEYSELMKDPEFSAADSALTRALVGAKKSLSKEAYDELRKNQREWIQITRDEEAEELIDMNGLSKVRAYTAITKNRADEIQSMVEKANRKIPEPGIVKADKDYVTVIAKGEGANRSEALEASWTEAVRLGVGMIISGKTELNNDELNESIIAHSRGAIEDFDVLDEQTTTAGTQIIIQARVHREVLEDVSKTYTEAQTVEADTGAVAEVIKGQENDKAKAATKQAKQKSGAELLKEFLDSYGPENFFSATLDPKINFAMNKEVPLVLLAASRRADTAPSAAASRRTGAAPSVNIAALRKPYVQVNEKFNQDVFWKEFIPKLHKTLEGVAVKKTKIFYADGVRKANQRFPKEGFFLMRGIVSVSNQNRGNTYYRDAKTNRTVEAYLPYYAYIGEDDKIYRVVVPHDNASYTVYDMPFRGMKGDTKRLRDFYAHNYIVPVDDSINEEGAAMLLAFFQFMQRMCRPVDYSVSYLDKNGEVMTIQIIRTGPRAFGVYRSFDGGQNLRKAALIFAPGFVNGDDENPVYGINPKRKYNLFLGTGNYNKAHPEAGYEVELDTEELKRLGSMKFEIIYENQ